MDFISQMSVQCQKLMHSTSHWMIVVTTYIIHTHYMILRWLTLYHMCGDKIQ